MTEQPKVRPAVRLSLGIAFGVLGILFALNGFDYGFRTRPGLLWAGLGVVFLIRGVIEVRTALADRQ